MPSKISDNTIKRLFDEYISSSESTKRLADKYGFNKDYLSKLMKRSIELGFGTSEEYKSAIKRRISEILKKSNKDRFVDDGIRIRLYSDYVYFDDSIETLAANYGIHKTNVGKIVKDAIRLNLGNYEVYRKALKRRRTNAGKKGGKIGGINVHKIHPELTQREGWGRHYRHSDDVVREIALLFIQTNRTRKEILQPINVNPTRMSVYMRKAIDLGVISEQEYRISIQRRSVFYGEIYGKIGGKIAQETIRQNKKYLYKGLYFASKQERVISTLIEHFELGKLIEGETYQVPLNGGIIDFFVLNKFLEYHPIILSVKNNGRGDLSGTEFDSLQVELNGLNTLEKRKIRVRWMEHASVHYYNKRRTIIDDNGYSDVELILLENYSDFRKKILLPHRINVSEKDFRAICINYDKFFGTRSI